MISKRTAPSRGSLTARPAGDAAMGSAAGPRHVRCLTPVGLILIAAFFGCRGEDRYALAIAPDDFITGITNPWFPLEPGATYTYESRGVDPVETVVVEVLDGTRVVNGVVAVVVRDRVYVDGALVEDTDDWFAQDSAGNVWYLGEDTKEIAGGRVTGTEGSWQWGIHGALPGIIMWADPAMHEGEAYRQEYAAGEAEDWGRVIASGVSITVAAGSWAGCIRTEDWSALERGSREHKTYCPGIGVVLEESLGGERLELIRIERRRSAADTAAHRGSAAGSPIG